MAIKRDLKRSNFFVIKCKLNLKIDLSKFEAKCTENLVTAIFCRKCHNFVLGKKIVIIIPVTVVCLKLRSDVQNITKTEQNRTMYIYTSNIINWCHLRNWASLPVLSID